LSLERRNDEAEAVPKELPNQESSRPSSQAAVVERTIPQGGWAEEASEATTVRLALGSLLAICMNDRQELEPRVSLWLLSGIGFFVLDTRCFAGCYASFVLFDLFFIAE